MSRQERTAFFCCSSILQKNATARHRSAEPAFERLGWGSVYPNSLCSCKSLPLPSARDKTGALCRMGRKSKKKADAPLFEADEANAEKVGHLAFDLRARASVLLLSPRYRRRRSGDRLSVALLLAESRV